MGLTGRARLAPRPATPRPEGRGREALGGACMGRGYWRPAHPARHPGLARNGLDCTTAGRGEAGRGVMLQRFRPGPGPELAAWHHQ